MIESPGRFALLGATYGSPEPDGAPAPGSVLNEQARSLLEHVLYVTLHCRQPVERLTWVAPHEPSTIRDFVSRLSRANPGNVSWQPDWVVRSREHGGLLVEKDGLVLFVRPAQFRPAGRRLVRAGTAGSVRMPKEYREMFSGFYMALGKLDNNAAGDIVRLYWNVSAEGAEQLLRRLAGGLNRATVPFRFKLLSNPLGYFRTDAAVLYLRTGDYARAMPVVRETYGAVRAFMKEPVSLYARCLAPGLGLAEQPPDHSSFGENRSRLLASALASATVAGEPGNRRARAVVEWLAQAGIDVAKPYLNAMSAGAYEALGQD